MSQKFKKLQNQNDDSTAFGKWFATAVYDQHFIETEQLADFIQTQASVKKSDIKAVLDELGSAMKHFFELGQKVRLDGIGIFKVGFSSEVRHRQDPRQGCGLRRDLRHRPQARERFRQRRWRRQRLNQRPAPSPLGAGQFSNL